MGTKWRRSPFNSSTLFADSRDGMNFLHFLLLAADFRAQKRLIAVAFLKRFLLTGACFLQLNALFSCLSHLFVDAGEIPR